MTISLKIRFAILLLLFVQVVLVLVALACVALTAVSAELVAAHWTEFHFRRFLLNPPKRPFFFGCVRWMHFIANFANPCARRIDRRSARGLHTFMWRVRTHCPNRLLGFDLLVLVPLRHPPTPPLPS